jgi:hypothetical protein
VNAVPDAWPRLTVSEWADARDTFHMWTQIVGKVRLALMPMLNHWWHVTLYVSARGLTTSLMHAGPVGIEMEFDFVDHVLAIRTSDGRRRDVKLEPRSVASFYDETMTSLRDLGVGVSIYPGPMEVDEAIPFGDDEKHRSYDPEAMQRFGQALLRIHEVMFGFRSDFIGKVSPIHFFWGGFDLAVTRFSGRRAPTHPGGVPHCPDWVQTLAYSHEVSSCGFWPSGDTEGVFYSYAYPAPAGFSEWRVAPDAAFFDQALGEFVLPYQAVREADDPVATLLAFFRSTYDAAAELGKWNRAELEADAQRTEGPPLAH